MRFLEFFAADIGSPHTRRAYARAAKEFLAWCSGRRHAIDRGCAAGARCNMDRSRDPRVVGAKRQATARGDPSPVRLARDRPARDLNPAGSVRGPRHVATSGQTAALDPAEARVLLDSIDTTTTHAGLRDRALIGLMVYSFARIGAALGMSVEEDVYTQNCWLWVRMRDDPKGPLFRTIGRGTGRLTRTALPQANAYG